MSLDSAPKILNNTLLNAKSKECLIWQNGWIFAVLDVQLRRLYAPNRFYKPLFTALHGMQTRSSDENYVRLSVKGVDCDKTEEQFVQIFIPCKNI